MCASVNQGAVKHYIRSRTPVLGFLGKDGMVEARWSGFARVETLGRTWRPAGVVVKVPATSYEEHGHTFEVPSGKCMAGIVLTQERFGHPQGSILLITRAAKTPEEKAVHDRHPLFIAA